MSEENKEKVVEAAASAEAKECKCCCKGWSAKALRWALPVSGVVAALAAITVVISGLGYLFCGGASFEKPDFDKIGVKVLEEVDAEKAEEEAKKAAKEFEEKWDGKLRDALKECDLDVEDAKEIAKQVRENALNLVPPTDEDGEEVDEDTLEDLHNDYVKGFLSWIKDAKKFAKKNDVSLKKDNGARVQNLLQTYGDSFEKNLNDVKKAEKEGEEKTDERAHRFTVALLVLAFALTVPVLVRIERNTRA